MLKKPKCLAFDSVRCTFGSFIHKNCVHKNCQCIIQRYIKHLLTLISHITYTQMTTNNIKHLKMNPSAGVRMCYRLLQATFQFPLKIVKKLTSSVQSDRFTNETVNSFYDLIVWNPFDTNKL